MKGVIESLVRNHVSGHFRGDGWVVPAVPVSLVGDGAEVLWRSPEPIPGAPAKVQVVGYNAVFELEIPSLRVHGDLYATPLPERIVQLRRRRLRRVSAPASARLSFAHPLCPERRIHRRLRDLSGEGLSFFAEPDDGLFPGLPILNAEVAIEGHPPVEVDLEIRRIGRAGESPFYGAEALPRDERAASRWRDLVLILLHPRTRRGAKLAPEIWDLYHRAGYFGLSDKEPGQFAQLRGPFLEIARKLDAAPQMGCHVGWQSSSGQLDATMTILKTYASSWLVLQLAKCPGKSRDGLSGRLVLRDVNEVVYEHAQFDPELRWLTALLQVKRVWSRLAYFEVPKRFEATGESCIVRNRVLEVPSEGWRPPVVPGIEISPAAPPEVDALLRELERLRPVAYREAQDLTPASIDLAAIKRVWKSAGFTRERQLLVARQGGRMVAAAVLESADEGLHLFRLLDSVRLYSLDAGGERAFTALLVAAQGWYRAHRRSAFICFLEADRPMPAEHELAGLTDLGLADLVILSAEHLPEQLEHIYEITAPPEQHE